MNRIEIAPQVFAILSALIEEKIGFHYSLDDKSLLADKVAMRAADAGFESLLDYYYYLRYDPGGEVELDALIDALVVGETYFFREFDQLEVMVDDIVVPIASSKRRPRIWSAACASGEEPLTIAMLLADRGILASVDLVASDVSLRALARSRAGEYGARALRSHVRIPPFAERYLEQQGDRIRVSKELRDVIDWRRINLLDRDAIRALGAFDVIACRNVLIYFSDEIARRVVESLTAQLTPGGALLVGASESLMRLGTALACEERRGAFIYRKVA